MLLFDNRAFQKCSDHGYVIRNRLDNEQLSMNPVFSPNQNQMNNLIKILVVEDEMVIGAKVSMMLTNLGYEVTGILPSGEDALVHLKENKTDIVLIDIHLKGKTDGIELAKKIGLQSWASIIYLTANTDEATFNRAKDTKPSAFISKPFKKLDLQRAIELTICRMHEVDTEVARANNLMNEQPVILSDRIFIRCKDKMMKIMVSDILYIEADRNYSRIFTRAKEYLLSTTLKTIEGKLSSQLFVRTHRSYVINLAHVDEVADDHVIISQKAIPLSSGMKEHLLDRIQTL